MGEIIALAVHFLARQGEDIKRAGDDSEIAALAPLGDNGHFCHSFHSLRIAIYCKADIPRFYLDLCTLITVGAAFGGPRF